MKLLLPKVSQTYCCAPELQTEWDGPIIDNVMKFELSLTVSEETGYLLTWEGEELSQSTRLYNNGVHRVGQKKVKLVHFTNLMYIPDYAQQFLKSHSYELHCLWERPQTKLEMLKQVRTAYSAERPALFEYSHWFKHSNQKLFRQLISLPVGVSSYREFLVKHNVLQPRPKPVDLYGAWLDQMPQVGKTNALRADFERAIANHLFYHYNHEEEKLVEAGRMQWLDYLIVLHGGEASVYPEGTFMYPIPPFPGPGESCG